jgi:CRP-like cAMP-binding protein
MNLQDFKLFNKVDPNQYLKYFKIIDYKKEDIIFNEGDVCNHLTFVLDGEISVRTYSLNGKEEILNIIYPGGIFGDIISYSNKTTYIGHIISNRNSVVAHIKKTDWITLIQKDETLLINFLNHLTNKTFKTKMDNKLLLHKNIEDRIYFYLNTQIDKKKTRKIYITSVTNLANELNLPRPSVSRSLSNMEIKGLIKRNKKEIEVL